MEAKAIEKKSGSNAVNEQKANGSIEENARVHVEASGFDYFGPHDAVT